MTIVLSAKLRRPEPGGLSRPRLERPLLQPPPGSGAGALDLVVAPAGSGKTTLLAQVAAAAAVPVAWYRVTADDGTEAAFAAHLYRALIGALSGPDPGSTENDPELMTELLARWDGLTRPVLVVLDDLHEIGGTPAERALESFVQLRPPCLRLLIGARRPPEINLPRLRLTGSVREWTGDDLRFRSWEVEELFVAVFAEPLPPEAAAALTRRTGGWAAALQLFHLATIGRSAAHRTQAVVELAHQHRLIRSYLVRNVLDELPPDQRSFLVRTSSLGVLTGELCDALLGTTGSHQLLTELERRQLFVTSDDDGRTFRYHEALRSHLEISLVDEYGRAGARAHYQRSGELLEDAGPVRAALHAYAKAENWAAVTRLIRQQESTGGDPGQVSGLDLGLPTAAVVTDPWLALTRARRLVRTGAFAAAVQAYRQAEALLDEPDFRSVCRAERSRAARWAPATDKPAAAGSAASSSTESFAVSSPVTHWADAIREILRGRSYRRAGVGPGWLLADATALAVAGDLPAARAVLDDLVPSADHDAAAVILLAQLARVVLALLDGADCAADLGRLALEADNEGLPWAARVAHGLAEASQLGRDGTADWRAASCDRLAGECELAGDPWGAAAVRLAMAAFDSHPGSAREVDLAAHGFDRLDAPVLALWIRALRAVLTDPPGSQQLAGLAAEAGRRGLAGLQSLLGPGRPGEEVATRLRRLGLGALAPVVQTEEVVPTEESATTDVVGQPPDDPPPEPNPELEIRCFGRFQLFVDGTECDLTGLRPMPRALLRLLVVGSDTEWHRERLVDLFWPQVDLTTGTRRLQVAISSIRQALDHHRLAGAQLLRRNGDGYRLVLPDSGRIDVREFEQETRTAQQARRHRASARAQDGHRQQLELSVAAAERSLGWYRGELLPEDGAADQIVEARDRYRLAAADLALGLAQDLQELGRTEDALVAGRRAVDLDPYRDESWTLLAELYDSAGSGSAAHRARADHERVIAGLIGR